MTAKLKDWTRALLHANPVRFLLCLIISILLFTATLVGVLFLNKKGESMSIPAPAPTILGGTSSSPWGLPAVSFHWPWGGPPSTPEPTISPQPSREPSSPPSASPTVTFPPSSAPAQSWWGWVNLPSWPSPWGNSDTDSSPESALGTPWPSGEPTALPSHELTSEPSPHPSLSLVPSGAPVHYPTSAPGSSSWWPWRS